jgi:carboxylesterase type B
VTIYGESAGAGSVTVQTVMRRSFGLFRSAITESGGFSQWVAKEMPRAEDVRRRWCRGVGGVGGLGGS